MSDERRQEDHQMECKCRVLLGGGIWLSLMAYVMFLYLHSTCWIGLPIVTAAASSLACMVGGGMDCTPRNRVARVFVIQALA